jgi:hypothetical protein
MPMIDVYAPAGAFEDKHLLARRLAAAVMVIEGVPDIAMFRQNTAVFIHELPANAIANVDGGSDYVRVQVLTNPGAREDLRHTLGHRSRTVRYSLRPADTCSSLRRASM